MSVIIELFCFGEISSKVLISLDSIIVEWNNKEVAKRVEVDSDLNVCPFVYKISDCACLGFGERFWSAIIIRTWILLARAALIIVSEHVWIVTIQVDTYVLWFTISLVGVLMSVFAHVSKFIGLFPMTGN